MATAHPAPRAIDRDDAVHLSKRRLLLAVASQFGVDDRLDARQILVRARRDPRNLRGNFGPVKELALQTIGPRAGAPSLRSIVDFCFVDLYKCAGVSFPTSSDSATRLQP